MSTLFDNLSKYGYWLVFIALETVSLLLLVRFNDYQASVWLTSANTVAGRVLEWESGLLSYLSLGERNRELTARNVELEQQVRTLETLLKEARHDSTKAEKRQAELIGAYGRIDARVVSNSVRLQDNFLTINKGEADGVKPETGVVCGTGLVGIVYRTSAHYSLVMSVLNAKSSISCRLRKSGYFGYLHWDGGSPLYAYLDDVPRHARFKVGDVVETSGYSAVFPAGIFVGVVDRINNSEDGLSYRLRIHLGTDFSRLTNVCVVSAPEQEEIHQLEENKGNNKRSDR
ncbi:MAG: rod shape-determining protein MreC [Paraprevotella sp.]|nr:rod shape-determining protein MreC [Paraprevotella sp.]